jgi:hypothetical protein
MVFVVKYANGQDLMVQQMDKLLERSSQGSKSGYICPATFNPWVMSVSRILLCVPIMISLFTQSIGLDS